ncbi:MAG: UbiD family decarboxylase [Lautropia sp.]
MNRLRARGELLVVEREVDPRHELAAVARRLQDQSRKPVLFNRVRGHTMPVLMNLYTDHARLCEMVGAGEQTFCERLEQLTTQPAAGSNGPGTTPDDTTPWMAGCLSDLPLLHHHTRDGGKYITSGVFLARNPSTGVPNLSFHRSLFVSDDELRIRLGSSHDLARFQREAEARGEALEAAILIGAPPPVFMAACVSLPPDGNELALAAAMQGAPFAMRRCKTIDLEVPAQTEIVIEGRILPNVKRPEGPFGEFMGYYVEVGDNHVFEVTHVCWRQGALYHGLICGSADDLRPLEAATAARIYKVLKAQVPGVLDVSCRPTVMNTIVKIRKQYEGHAGHVLLAAMGSHLDYNKLVVVVDEDVDIYDMEEVIWAFLTRGRADTRTLVVPNVAGFYRDAHKDHWGRLGLDATKPWGREAEFERKDIPGTATLDLADYLPGGVS